MLLRHLPAGQGGTDTFIGSITAPKGFTLDVLANLYFLYPTTQNSLELHRCLLSTRGGQRHTTSDNITDKDYPIRIYRSALCLSA